MAQDESSAQQPEEEVLPPEEEAKVWEYDWPEGELIDKFAKAKEYEKWLKLCTTEEEAFGEHGHHLAGLMKNGNLPSPDDVAHSLKHPLINERVLRLCNEVFDSTAGTELTDPSRALVLLGAKTLRNLAFVTTIFNRVLVEPTPKIILPEIARCYLAGVYAVLFSRCSKKILNAEEIFVAASMHYMGRLLMLYFGGDKAQELEKKIKEKGLVNEQMEYDIFNFTSPQLSHGLAKICQLGDTFIQTSSLKNAPETEAIFMALDFTDALFEGHGSNNFFDVKRQSARFCNLNADEMQDLILEGLERGIEGLSLFDNPDLIEFVPYPKEQEQEGSVDEVKAQEQLLVSSEFVGEPDLEAVKACIQQMVKIPLTKEPSMSELMRVAAQGLFKGGDFDRVLIAFLEADRKKANSKFLHQATPESLLERFNLEATDADFFKEVSIDLMKAEGYLLRNILRESKVAWVGSSSSIVIRKLRNNAFNRKFGRGQFFVAPIVVKKHKLGFYLCDRQPSHRKLDVKSYDAFMDICLQANKSLELVREQAKEDSS